METKGKEPSETLSPTTAQTTTQTMAQNPQGSKPKWKVGSFLQQAVAGVESKLDFILSEEEQQQQQQMQARNAAAMARRAESPGGGRWFYFWTRRHGIANELVCSVAQFVECAQE